MSDQSHMDDLCEYDYELPQDLIASRPLAKRDGSRLLVVDRSTGTVCDRMFRDLPSLLQPGDCLILNDTRVLPARLHGIRDRTAGRWEGLFLEADQTGNWRLICETRGRLRAGESVTVHPAHGPAADHSLTIELLQRDDDGVWTARPQTSDPSSDVLEQFGTVPLPPYIGRRFALESDWQRYQTTFARIPGAVAAPTAGLHFTPEILEQCRRRGVSTQFVTLHVGIGTFRPIVAEKLSHHRMHEERYTISRQTVNAVRDATRRGGRVVAVGTTTVRTLESAAGTGELKAGSGRTSLFIRPPYRMCVVDTLLTNFHLPGSTLLVLVTAMAGGQLIRTAYRHAIEQRYRFYSYGDAMLIV